VIVLVFVYDGSLNGDWVAHFAANTPERRLRLLHVHDRSPSRTSPSASRASPTSAGCSVWPLCT
jgi:hypothetical protein